MLPSERLVANQARVSLKYPDYLELVNFDSLFQAELFLSDIPERMRAGDPRLRGLQSARLAPSELPSPDSDLWDTIDSEIYDFV